MYMDVKGVTCTKHAQAMLSLAQSLKAYMNYAFVGSTEHGGAASGVKEAGQSSKDARDASMRTPGESRPYSMGGYVISLVKVPGGALKYGIF